MHDLVKSFLSFSFGLFCHEGKPWTWGPTPCRFCPRVITWLYFNVPGWSWKSRLLTLSKHRFLRSSPKVLHYRAWNLGICIFNKFPVCLIRTEIWCFSVLEATSPKSSFQQDQVPSQTYCREASLPLSSLWWFAIFDISACNSGASVSASLSYGFLPSSLCSDVPLLIRTPVIPD